ncbi:hypothetical protein SLEP1_g37883 [Rubroshorea leprosula]|uniref:Uncharacterized protein n=1 Tax=Rubroshorea leprosula TaxID=152421 RepID=A0AAV5KWN6_9ROSI|nr:hypothetical protein SLEP1_g37883 [Rubroshorea leprosula]
MPSKAKKQSKTPSRPSSYDPSAFPRTPSVISLSSEVSEEDPLKRLLVGILLSSGNLLSLGVSMMLTYS